jgi:hypothetical protein
LAAPSCLGIERGVSCSYAAAVATVDKEGRMAVAMFLSLRVPAGTYDRLLQSLEFDVSPPIGEILHLAAETPDGLEVCEIWQTREAAESFLRDVLEPKLKQFGANEPVAYAIFPLHNLYAPDLDTIERIGTVSLPGLPAGAIFR